MNVLMAILESCWRSRLLLSLGFPAVGLWPPVSLCVSAARLSCSFNIRRVWGLTEPQPSPRWLSPFSAKEGKCLDWTITSFWRQIGRYQQKCFIWAQGTWLSSLICPSFPLPLGTPFQKDVELPLFSQSSSWPPQTWSALPSRLILLAKALAFIPVSSSLWNRPCWQPDSIFLLSMRSLRLLPSSVSTLPSTLQFFQVGQAGPH